MKRKSPSKFSQRDLAEQAIALLWEKLDTSSWNECTDDHLRGMAASIRASKSLNPVFADMVDEILRRRSALQVAV